MFCNSSSRTGPHPRPALRPTTRVWKSFKKCPKTRPNHCSWRNWINGKSNEIMSQGQEIQEQLSPLKRAILELREMRAKLDEMDRRQKEPIAIVGIGLRLPGGAHDESSLWQILAQGVDAISEIPRDR